MQDLNPDQTSPASPAPLTGTQPQSDCRMADRLSESPTGLALRTHAARRALHDESHARPFPQLTAPQRISHLALYVGEQGKHDDLAHLADLCRRYSVNTPDHGATTFSCDFGAFRLRYERHTEFATYTIMRPGPFDQSITQPFDDNAISLLPTDWLAQLRGEVVAALHVVIEPQSAQPRTLDQLHDLFEGQRMIGCQVVDDATTVWSAFRLHADGFGRMLIHDHGLTNCRLGRLVQRLLDVETYRLMAMLALPVARDVGPRITQLDNQLATITGAIANTDHIHSDTTLLKQLSDMAAHIEQLRATTQYRFSAARAYHDLVNQRLDAMRQSQINGLQTFGEFINLRLTPAMSTCDSVRCRLDDLAIRVHRATDLLRTRVDVTLETQNQQVLASMNQRSHLRLRLAQAVEGLSVAGVTYYLIGLIKHALVALEHAGLPFDPVLATGFAVPVVALLVFLATRKIHRHIKDNTPPT